MSSFSVFVSCVRVLLYKIGFELKTFEQKFLVEWYQGEWRERRNRMIRIQCIYLSFLNSFCTSRLAFSYFFFILYEAIVYFCTHQNRISRFPKTVNLFLPILVPFFLRPMNPLNVLKEVRG